jgi:hypothetical protein
MTDRLENLFKGAGFNVYRELKGLAKQPTCTPQSLAPLVGRVIDERIKAHLDERKVGGDRSRRLTPADCLRLKSEWSRISTSAGNAPTAPIHYGSWQHPLPNGPLGILTWIIWPTAPDTQQRPGQAPSEARGHEVLETLVENKEHDSACLVTSMPPNEQGTRPEDAPLPETEDYINITVVERDPPHDLLDKFRFPVVGSWQTFQEKVGHSSGYDPDDFSIVLFYRAETSDSDREWKAVTATDTEAIWKEFIRSHQQSGLAIKLNNTNEFQSPGSTPPIPTPPLGDGISARGSADALPAIQSASSPSPGIPETRHVLAAVVIHGNGRGGMSEGSAAAPQGQKRRSTLRIGDRNYCGKRMKFEAVTGEPVNQSEVEDDGSASEGEDIDMGEMTLPPGWVKPECSRIEVIDLTQGCSELEGLERIVQQVWPNVNLEALKSGSEVRMQPLKWMASGSPSRSMVFAWELEMYQKYAPVGAMVAGRPLPNLVHSSLQQVARQDPFLWALASVALKDHRLIAVPRSGTLGDLPRGVDSGRAFEGIVEGGRFEFPWLGLAWLPVAHAPRTTAAVSRALRNLGGVVPDKDGFREVKGFHDNLACPVVLNNPVSTALLGGLSWDSRAVRDAMQELLDPEGSAEQLITMYGMQCAAAAEDSACRALIRDFSRSGNGSILGEKAMSAQFHPDDRASTDLRESLRLVESRGLQVCAPSEGEPSGLPPKAGGWAPYTGFDHSGTLQSAKNYLRDLDMRLRPRALLYPRATTTGSPLPREAKARARTRGSSIPPTLRL